MINRIRLTGFQRGFEFRSPALSREWPRVRRPLSIVAIALAAFSHAVAALPVAVEPVHGRNSMVVAGHPEAAQIGLDILNAGGNAMDAAVGVSLALGIAEPYGSGLGGKLMLLYHDAATGSTHAVDGMDQAGWSIDPAAYAKLDERARSDGWSSVCVPGLPAALHRAHGLWGTRPWASNVAPATELARRGFTVLPKTRAMFEERLDKLRGGDPDLARLYLPGGNLPEEGSLLPNEDLARTLDTLAREGADGFYRGWVAGAIVAGSEKGGGFLTLADLSQYEVRVTEPVGIRFRGATILGGPPPTTGAALAFTALKAIEDSELSPPFRSAANLDLVGRIWREVQSEVQKRIADSPDSRQQFEQLTGADTVAAIRRRAGMTISPAAIGRAVDGVPGSPVALMASSFLDNSFTEDPHAATTHFIVVDSSGNVVCATQSQSLHFGAGVVAPGTGIVMNDSMSNFAYATPASVNYVAPGKRPRSTIAPTIVIRDGRPVVAIGVPGAARIPSAVLQGLVDHLVFQRPLEAAIGDTRIHWAQPAEKGGPPALESESTLDGEVAAALRAMGWDVRLRETPGTGRHFGGMNAVQINSDGSRTGFADSRRTNAAKGN